MENYTIAESYQLPSKGLIYDRDVDCNVRLRSMTTEEEMKRLSPADTPCKVLCEIIEDCLLEKPKIPVYDMCLGDYQYLLHKLRVVTYGPEYKLNIRCPICGEVETVTINLDDLKPNEFNLDELKEALKIELPVTKKVVQLKLQTPRSIDDIALRKKELQKKVDYDPELSLTLCSLIKTIDGQVFNQAQLETFVRKLPMADANVIIQTAGKLGTMIGLDLNLEHECKSCGYDINTPFRITSEFFGPSIY